MKRFYVFVNLAVLVTLTGCFEKKAPQVIPSEEASTPPIDPKVLDEKPAAQENIGGVGPSGPDSIDEEGSMLEPLPPASPGSPYRSSEKTK